MKTLPESTYEILLWKHLGKSVDEAWINWAYEMLLTGYENEYLIELAGEQKPYNQFELNDLTDRVFESLGLDIISEKAIFVNYVRSIIKQVLVGKMSIDSAFIKFNDLYFHSNFEDELLDIRLLSYAKQELEYTTWQSYWEGANRENIDEICLNYFKKWLGENDYISPFPKK